MSSRKEVETFIIKYIDKILPGSGNGDLYKNVLFKNMTNDEFDTFIDDLKSGKKHLSIIAPNDGNHDLNTKRNIKIAKELGHNFFHKLTYSNDPDLPDYQSPVLALVYKIPFRRTSQLLVKKMGIPEDDKHVDLSTNQPVGPSKGSKLSYVELQMLVAMGLDSSIQELLKYRGGDKGGHAAMKIMLSKYGKANQKTLSKFATGVVSTDTLNTYLTAMHLKNNL